MPIKEPPKEAMWIERDKRTKFRGKVIDEVRVKEEFEFGDYCKMIQCIERDNGERVIRFGYYVKPHGSDDSRYIWGSQNTLIVTQENARKLFNEAKEKGVLKKKKRRRRYEP